MVSSETILSKDIRLFFLRESTSKKNFSGDKYIFKSKKVLGFKIKLI